jgi:hypothetical protein
MASPIASSGRLIRDVRRLTGSLMNFFLSGELDQEVSDAWRAVANNLERRLNSFFQDRDYGAAVKEIGVIPMILRPEIQAGRRERRLFQRKQLSADYRTFIDFEEFKSGDKKLREKLLLRNILEAITDLSRKAGKDFNGEQLISDILDLFGQTRAELAIA